MQRSADQRARQLARAELIGRKARVSASSDATLLNAEGRIVDETKHTLTLQTGSGRRTVPKPGQQFAIQHEDREVLLNGDEIAHRPEERVKKAKVDR